MFDFRKFPLPDTNPFNCQCFYHVGRFGDQCASLFGQVGGLVRRFYHVWNSVQGEDNKWIIRHGNHAVKRP